MKDPADKFTLDVFGQKRKGRPPTGKAKSAAQRKREQRARDRAIVWDSATVDLTTVNTTALLEQLSVCVATGSPQVARWLADEIVRRAQIKSES